MNMFIRCLVLLAASVMAVEGRTDPILDLIKKQLELGKGDLIVNVNTATPTELETIPCIGEALARGIIKGRTYEKVEGKTQRR